MENTCAKTYSNFRDSKSIINIQDFTHNCKLLGLNTMPLNYIYFYSLIHTFRKKQKQMLRRNTSKKPYAEMKQRPYCICMSVIHVCQSLTSKFCGSSSSSSTLISVKDPPASLKSVIFCHSKLDSIENPIFSSMSSLRESSKLDEGR